MGGISDPFLLRVHSAKVASTAPPDDDCIDLQKGLRSLLASGAVVEFAAKLVVNENGHSGQRKKQKTQQMLSYIPPPDAPLLC